MAEIQETCESVFRQTKLVGGRRDGRTHGESHNVTHVVEAPMPSIGGGKLFTWSDVEYKIAEGSLETVPGI